MVPSCREAEAVTEFTAPALGDWEEFRELRQKSRFRLLCLPEPLSRLRCSQFCLFAVLSVGIITFNDSLVTIVTLSLQMSQRPTVCL